jgi:hypothetical protein
MAENVTQKSLTGVLELDSLSYHLKNKKGEYTLFDLNELPATRRHLSITTSGGSLCF